MKKVNIVCVGKIKEKFIADGIAEYAKRISKYAEFKITELADYPCGFDSVKKESENILASLKGYVILLDIGGKLLSSEELSVCIDKAYSIKSEITFIIGGSCGVAEEVRQAADLRLSFGRVTFPHMLMRLMLTEQIYRAFTITANTAYHK